MLNLGVKHRKVINKMSNSSDPEDAVKLKKAIEQAAHLKSGGESNTKDIKSEGSSETLKTSTPTSPSHISSQPLMTVELSKTSERNERNLPPGYMIIPSKVPSQPETFVCKVCNHSSNDVFSVNAVINI